MQEQKFMKTSGPNGRMCVDMSILESPADCNGLTKVCDSTAGQLVCDRVVSKTLDGFIMPATIKLYNK